VALEEPSLGELIRTQSAKIETLTVHIDSLRVQLTGYVTQEQRSADREVADLRRQAILARIDLLEKSRAEAVAERKADRRLLWSAVLGPVIVGLVLWFLIGGGAK